RDWSSDVCSSDLGGDHAQQVHVGAHAAQTGSQGGCQHIAGNTGIFTDQDFGPMAVQLRQHGGGTAADLQRQFTGQIFARYAADTVSSKQFTHNHQILSSFGDSLYCMPPACPAVRKVVKTQNILCWPSSSSSRRGTAMCRCS